MVNEQSTGGGPRPTFPPFSADQVEAVKAAVAEGGPLTCPVCGDPLSVLPFDMMGMGETVFELRCEPCRHFLVIRSLPEHLR